MEPAWYTNGIQELYDDLDNGNITDEEFSNDSE